METDLLAVLKASPWRDQILESFDVEIVWAESVREAFVGLTLEETSSALRSRG